mgnify:CR=1 FL=1
MDFFCYWINVFLTSTGLYIAQIIVYWLTACIWIITGYLPILFVENSLADSDELLWDPCSLYELQVMTEAGLCQLLNTLKRNNGRDRGL